MMVNDNDQKELGETSKAPIAKLEPLDSSSEKSYDGNDANHRKIKSIDYDDEYENEFDVRYERSSVQNSHYADENLNVNDYNMNSLDNENLFLGSSSSSTGTFHNLYNKNPLKSTHVDSKPTATPASQPKAFSNNDDNKSSISSSSLRRRPAMTNATLHQLQTRRSSVASGSANTASSSNLNAGLKPNDSNYGFEEQLDENAHEDSEENFNQLIAKANQGPKSYCNCLLYTSRRG